MRFMRSDNRQVSAKDSATSAAPPTAVKPIGTVNVHLTIPMPLKNSAVNGLIIRHDSASPMTVDSIIAGMKESAVCNISRPVVKPIAFNTP